MGTVSKTSVVCLLGLVSLGVGCSRHETNPLLSTPEPENEETAVLMASTAGNPPVASVSPYYCEGEYYSTKVNGRFSTISYDYKPKASRLNTVHIGSNSSNVNYGVGDTVNYSINFTKSFVNATLQIRYSDDVAGNQINVYFDNVLKGTLTTARSGGWNVFVWHPTLISIGEIGPGSHVVKFQVIKGGSYGMDLDQFVLRG